MCDHLYFANITYKTERGTDAIIGEYCKNCGAVKPHNPFSKWRNGTKNKVFSELAYSYGVHPEDLTIWFPHVIGKKVEELL